MPTLAKCDLVLIPGLFCNSLLWRSQISGLCDLAQIEVGDITRAETMTDMAQAILSSVPDRFSLAGFSLGSQVALEIMRTAGDRVDRLALLSATHGGVPPPVAKALHEAILTIEQDGLEQYLETAYPTYVAPVRAKDLALKSTFFEMATQIGPEAGIRQIHALLSLQVPFSNLKAIRCPTFVIGGQEDRRTTPQAHHLLSQEIPDSQFIMVENAAHFTPLERPETVTNLLRRWLTLGPAGIPEPAAR
jgi:pimeloyl-ACP methyl ester carboxylesterase